PNHVGRECRDLFSPEEPPLQILLSSYPPDKIANRLVWHRKLTETGYYLPTDPRGHNSPVQIPELLPIQYFGGKVPGRQKPVSKIRCPLPWLPRSGEGSSFVQPH